MQTFLGFERRQPRPRIKCECCNLDLVLKWGDKKRPHFSHIGGKSGGCSGGGEGAIHKIAKTFLADFLKNGGTIHCQFVCCVECGKNHVYNIKTRDNDQVVIECPVSNGVADIAIVGNDGAPRFLIEVLNTHRTTHRDLPWVELDATAILETWETTKDLEATWRLQCVRQDVDKPNTCVALGGSSCLSMFQIGVDMGYLLKYSPSGKYYFKPECPSHVDIDAVNHGCFDYVWQTRSYQDIPPELWTLFLGRRKCMKCKVSWNVKMMRPFCHTCYAEIKKGCAPISSVLTAEEKLQLEQRYSFLDDIPSRCYVCCYVCRMVSYSRAADALLRKFFPAYAYLLKPEHSRFCVSWFGEEKIICALCLENLVQMEEYDRCELFVVCGKLYYARTTCSGGLVKAADIWKLFRMPSGYEDVIARETELKSTWVYK